MTDPTKIHCRISGCLATKPRLKGTNSSEDIKQGFFLCRSHREALTKKVAKRCADEDVFVDVPNLKQEDFIGYTSLIDQLERAFTHFWQPSVLPHPSDTKSLLAEVFLNTRNFLFITSTLLNPDEDNTVTVLAPYLRMFQVFLCCLEKPKLFERMLTALQEVMNIILLFFGIMYPWVSLQNPDKLIWGMLGGMLGFILGALGGETCKFCPTWQFAIAAVGLFAGYRIGKGAYDFSRERKAQTELIQQHQELMIKLLRPRETVIQQPEFIWLYANANGDLFINIELIP